MIIFGIFGIIFLSLGILLYIMSEDILIFTKEYSDICKKIGEECTITIEIEEEIPSPVYVYYQLDNFYQNHRRYVKSRSNKQLMGNWYDVSSTEIKECDPITKNSDLEKG